ncbi:hypothetical protein G7054_g6025 [Neopestalotiopsis clavispora]|nr:hypothetical protein G7054_g6025 [Neopestalotiopsis clavispora]
MADSGDEDTSNTFKRYFNSVANDDYFWETKKADEDNTRFRFGLPSLHRTGSPYVPAFGNHRQNTSESDTRVSFTYPYTSFDEEMLTRRLARQSHDAPAAAAGDSKPGSEAAVTATIPLPSVTVEVGDSGESSTASPIAATQPVVVTPQSTGNHEIQPANDTADSSAHAETTDPSQVARATVLLAEDPTHRARALPDDLDDLPEESWDLGCDVLDAAGRFLCMIGQDPIPFDPNVVMDTTLERHDAHLTHGDSGPRPVISIRSKRAGAPDIQIKVHWDYKAECITFTDESTQTQAAPEQTGERTTADAATNTPFEPEPVQKEAEPQVEEEIDPHSLPEIHHQQQSEAHAQPASGPHDPANTAARTPNQGSFIQQSPIHIYAGASTPVYVHQQPPFGQPMPMNYGAGQYVTNPQMVQNILSMQQVALQQARGTMANMANVANEPYLLMNPPVVPPTARAPAPGTGGWCYPNQRQASFQNGAAANPTIIVGQPGAQPVFPGGQTPNVFMYR